jgi:tetratricopeptide (TPR) repeat protein
MPNRRSVRSILLVFAITLAWLVLSPPSLLAQASSPVSQSLSFESLAGRATAAREQGKPDDAIRYYQQALQIHPEWEEGWWYVGTLLYDGNHFAEALPAFAQVVELDPNMGPAWSFLGLCAFETRDYPAALTNLEKGHELGSAQVPEIAKVADYHLALLQIRAGDFDAATKLLSSEFVHGQVADQVKIALGLALLRVPLLAEEVDPSKDAVVATAGSIAVLLAQDQRTEALQLLQQAIKDYPDIPNFRAAYAAIAQPGTAAAQPPYANERTQTARLFARNTSATKSATAVSSAGSSSTNFDHLAKKAVAERDAGNADAAIKDYQAALQLRPTWEDGWWDLSLIFFSNARYPEAIGSLKHVVDLKPGFGTAWAMLGLSEYETTDYKNSLIHLSKAQGLGIQGSPEAIRIAQYHLAVLLNQSGEFERAVDLLAAGHAEGPLAAQWNMALGMGLLRVPLLPEQVSASQQPMLVSAGEAASLLANSKYDDAFVILQKLVKEYPTTPFIHYAYGSALASLSQYDEAESQLRDEIRISPGSALPYIRIAFIALKTQRPGDALTAAQRAVQLAPQSAEAHYILGRALLGSGDTQQAIHELETANGMMPNSPEIHFHLARAYSKAKQPEKAEQEREIFARLNTVAEQQRSMRGSQAYGASHDQSDLSLPVAAPPADRGTQQ